MRAESLCLLGAECTGKSTLTQALAEALPARPVFEYLREWCLRERRTPRQHEQAGIAAEQQRRIEAACAVGEGRLTPTLRSSQASPRAIEASKAA